MYSKPDYFSLALCPIQATIISHRSSDTAAQLMSLFQLLTLVTLSPSLNNQSNHWIINFSHVTILLKYLPMLSQSSLNKSILFMVTYISNMIFPLPTSLMLLLPGWPHFQAPSVSCCSCNKQEVLFPADHVPACCYLCWYDPFIPWMPSYTRSLHREALHWPPSRKQNIFHLLDSIPLPYYFIFYYTYHYNYLIFLFFKLMCLLLFSSQAERMQKKCMFDFYSVFRTYVCFSTCTVGTLSNVEYEHESVRYKQGIHLIVQ